MGNEIAFGDEVLKKGRKSLVKLNPFYPNEFASV